jgi:hypothetical protein
VQLARRLASPHFKVATICIRFVMEKITCSIHWNRVCGKASSLISAYFSTVFLHLLMMSIIQHILNLLIVIIVAKLKFLVERDQPGDEK